MAAAEESEITTKWCPEVRIIFHPTSNIFISNRGDISDDIPDTNCIGSSCALWVPGTHSSGKVGGRCGKEIQQNLRVAILGTRKKSVPIRDRNILDFKF